MGELIDIPNTRKWREQLEQVLKAGDDVVVINLRLKNQMMWCMELSKKYGVPFYLESDGAVRFSKRA